MENNTPNADSVDWVTAGCVNAIQNQGSCGSCWAFSTVASMEGAHCVKDGVSSLVKLSEQEVVDCDTKDGNQGCNGGDMATAMKWTESNELALESDYSYKGKDGTCKESSVTGVVGCTSYVNVAAGSSSGRRTATAPTARRPGWFSRASTTPTLFREGRNCVTGSFEDSTQPLHAGSCIQGLEIMEGGRQDGLSTRT